MTRTLFLAAMMASASSLAFAQSGSEQPTSPTAGESSVVGELIVTAQRRAQSIRDIGISITAFSGDELTEKGIVSSADLGRTTPGVFVSGSAAGQSSQYSIRGVTQSDFNDAIEAPVAVYIDDTYIPSQQGQTLAAYDLERVEVLKGPQGTLFGRNATGGLVQFVVRKPTDEFSADLTAEYGSYNLVRLQGGVGGPLADGVSFRLSGYYSRHDDIWDNRAPRGGLAPGAPSTLGASLPACCHSLWNDDSKAVRAQLKFDPTDSFTVRFRASYDSQKTNGAPTIHRPTLSTVDAQGRVIQSDFAGPAETRIAILPGGGNVGSSMPGTFLFAPASGVRIPGTDFFGYNGNLVGGDRETSLDFAAEDLNTFSNYTGAMYVDWDLGDVSLSSITDYKLNKKELFVDLEASPVNVGSFETRARNESFAQEIRLSGSTSTLKWQTGVSTSSTSTPPAPGVWAHPPAASWRRRSACCRSARTWSTT